MRNRVLARALHSMAAGLAMLTIASPAGAQVIVKVNDATFFRLGFQLQGWADWAQDPVGGGYSQNLFIRRLRFILLGQISPTVTIFFQTDDQRLGNAGTGTTTPTKSLTSGFVVQDAFGEWKLAGERLMLDAGLFYVPVARSVLTSRDVVSRTCRGLLQGRRSAAAGAGLGPDFRQPATPSFR